MPACSVTAAFLPYAWRFPADPSCLHGDFFLTARYLICYLRVSIHLQPVWLPVACLPASRLQLCSFMLAASCCFPWLPCACFLPSCCCFLLPTSGLSVCLLHAGLLCDCCFVLPPACYYPPAACLSACCLPVCSAAAALLLYACRFLLLSLLAALCLHPTYSCCCLLCFPPAACLSACCMPACSVTAEFLL
jgi:hypothetical protein